MNICVFAIIILCFSHLTFYAVSQDIEFIPDELRTPGAENLGRSLSLVITKTHRQKDQRADDVQKEKDIDQAASGSELLGPGFDVGYGELGQFVSGGQLADERYIQQQGVGNTRGEVGFYGRAGQLGSAGHTSDDAFLANHAAVHGDRADSGFYGNVDGGQQGYNAGNAYYGIQALNRKGLSAIGGGSKGGYRKGHHSSGFHNSYHKDESGNNTSYYDEAIDDGGRYFVDTRDGAFIDQGGNAFKGAFQDGAYRNGVKGSEGQYGTAQEYGDARGQKGNYGRGEFYDDSQGYGQQKANERHNNVAHLRQAEGSGGIYGNVGTGGIYGHIVNKPYSVVAYSIPKAPVVYEHATIPVTASFPNQGKDYYRYPAYDYYSDGNYETPVSDGYEQAVNTRIQVPDHFKGLNGQGYATYVNTLPYISHTSGKYYGTYRGVPY